MTMTPEMPKLCGGVLFNLLVNSKRSRHKANDSFMGESDGLSNVNCLKGLIRVFYPDFPEPYEKTFKTNTTEYKKCEVSSNAYLPFDDEDKIQEFDNAVRTSYPDVLTRAGNYARTFFALAGKGSKLCESIIALIAIDSTIDDEEAFFALPSGNAIKKKDLIRSHFVYWPSLLVGVWHFIVTKRKDNTIGAATVRDMEAGVAAWTNHSFLDGITGPIKREYIFDLGDVRRPSKEEDDDEEYLTHSLPTENYTEYLASIIKKYGSINTLLYKEDAHPFYEFYVCNRVFQMLRIKADGRPSFVRRHIDNLDIVKIEKSSRLTLVSGTGGLGKSMMMRHLLLNTAGRFNELNLVPVFVPLKDYGRKGKEIIDMAYDIVFNNSSSVSKAGFIEDLEAGNIVILLDGLDEISSSLRGEFDNALDTFTATYKNCICVVSSRPFSSYAYLNKFSIMDLCAFDKKQALELVEKLNFRPDDPSIKEKFYEELNSRLYETHNDFARNPLLLTIMLMTYEQYAEVPSKMHIFYQEAYATLSQKHDASKGAYKRALRTGLTADRFADYFAEFCAKTYLQEKFELTRSEIDDVYNGLRVKQKDGMTATADDFIFDLVSNMCLMYYEDGKYQFTHRSFQEYFCALCFSKWKDKNLEKVGDFFERQRNRGDEDLTFNMLYDMIPEKVEEYIFEPHLKKLYAKCDSNAGYWTFLETIYPVITYTTGEALSKEKNGNERASYLFSFIASPEGLNKGENTDYLSLPDIESLRTGELVSIELSPGHPAIMQKGIDDKLAEDEEMFFGRYGSFQHVGWMHEFKIRDILRHKDQYADLMLALNADEFPMKKEYEAMRRYLYELEKVLVTPGDDLLDLF